MEMDDDRVGMSRTAALIITLNRADVQSNLIGSPALIGRTFAGAR